VTDTSQPAAKPTPRTTRWSQTRSRRLVALVIFLACVGAAYVIGLETVLRDLNNQKQLVAQLQLEGQRAKEKVVAQDAELVTLRSNLAKVQAALNEIMPVKDTYHLTGNQSFIVANGRMTIGLIGSPGNQTAILNINGKQQTVAPGDVVSVPPDCSVRVQAFDMFVAVVTATCGAAK